ncbi:MAG: antibiotic biosynthesis monooxygenase family protein [Caulobacteraceae bacterium]
MSLTLVNLFTVPAGEEDAFEARFKTVCEKLEGMPGFEGTELHRNAGVGDQSYAFVNIARWASADACARRCRRSWPRAACCRAGLSRRPRFTSRCSGSQGPVRPDQRSIIPPSMNSSAPVV